ncbi:MAG: SLC13 family permease [Proteobacteria bacterium]|jgi:di/tricarboxylate transporter|nr:SLC13 family permease [Pseudomonadota bacterium]
MTLEQVYVFAILAVTLGLFIWGRWRYDVVALLALLAVIICGIVPATAAFEGFGHPAVITVAAVLIISRSLQSSGIIGWITRWLDKLQAGPSIQIAAIAGLVAVLSGFMNNVGALALLLPVVVQTAERTGRAPGELMMPLAFGSLLGGLTTMVGTPPNIIIASFRAKSAGVPFGMFDFTPVGLVIAIAGITFMAAYGWRLIPIRTPATSTSKLFNIEDYISEVLVPRKSGLSGTSIQDLLTDAGEEEVAVLALMRRGKKIIRPKLNYTVRINDRLLLEGSAEATENILMSTPLKLMGKRNLDTTEFQSDDSGVIEAVVTPGSKLIRRSIAQAQLERRYGLNLLALARQGRQVRKELRKVLVRPGDVLLLQGQMDTIMDSLAAIGCLPLAGRNIALHREPTLVPLVIFSVAIALGVSGLLSLPIAFTGAVVALVLSGQIRARELYQEVDWPVIVLLGAMVPVGMAMEQSGANSLLADGIAALAAILPAWSIVMLMLMAAMFLSDIMNNAATAILMSQLSIQVAERLDISADPLLMAVAIGASCAFLTPIGHQSNILVMGPGGYRFGDYWRLGLPLEALIVLLAVPLILLVWPL